MFDLRPPREAEWPICRMLLPETFGGAAAREYLLCLSREAQRTIAAVSFLRSSTGLVDLRLHVIPPERRRGVGSRIVTLLTQLAPSLEGRVELPREGAAETFCIKNGFKRADGLTTVEAEMAAMREYMHRLRERMGTLPSAVILRAANAPLDQVAALHARHVAHGETNSWRALVAEKPSLNDSPVAMVDGRVAGILLGEIEDGVAVIRSRAVEPGPHAGWINAALLAEGLDRGWSLGARRVRFNYNDANRDTKKLAARFGAAVIQQVAVYKRL